MTVEERFEEVLQLLADFATAIEAQCVMLKQRIKEVAEHELGLKEDIFTILKWEPKQGERLGEFEVATKDKNDLNAWNHAYNVLKANNATINNHFGSKSWKHYYWLFDGYPDVIFRKRRSN